MFKITLISFALCFLVERLFNTGWKLPRVPGWYLRVFLLNGIQLGVVALAGLTWEKWLSGYSLFHLSKDLNPWAGGFVAYFIATFFFYWWHRLRHDSDFLWRYFHQIHHSPQRLEVITSFYKHPQEMIVNSILGSLIVYSLLGLSLEAGAAYTLFTALGEFFYHTNFKTPRWIGYVFQRPEMHRIHHEFNRHKNNYGDFVIWDMMFGTYENPKTWSGKCGFDQEKELRLKDMFFLKDVHKLVLAAIAILFWSLHQPASAQSAKFKSWNEACAVAESVVAEGDLIFLDIPDLVFRSVAEASKSWTSHVGVAFKERGQWVVSESTIPLSGDTPLCEYLKNSSEYRFEIRRLKEPLTPEQISKMREKAISLVGKLYHLGFDFDSSRLFCSKLAYLVYQSVGIEIGRIQTFKQLLEENPDSSSLMFWRLWFLGFIPWDHRTITPASELQDPKFFTVLASF